MADDLGIEERLVRQSAEFLTRSRHVVALTGAGIILQDGTTPIFPDQVQPQCKTAYPCLGSEDFLDNPAKIWQFYQNRKRMLKKTCPTPSHAALAEMEELLEDFLLITQNTDGLHQRAGSTKLIELYGNIWTSRCVRSDFQARREDDFEAEPRCPKCGDWLRPAVIWADESLPAEEFAAAREACENADLLITIGAIADVQPMASLIWQAKATDSVIIEINPSVTAASHFVDLRLATIPEKAIPALVSALKELLVHRAS